MAHEPDAPIDKQQALLASEVFLRSLAEHGVDFFFANPGTDFPPIVEAFGRARLTNAAMPQPILVPHENLAVAMAHGAYLMTGRPQAVMVHVNVGTANAINNLINLSRDRIPLLLAAGRTPVTETGMFGSRSRPIHWAQEMFDQAGMVRELVKWDYELRVPTQISDVVTRAFEVAMTPPRGPVYLVLPREPLSTAVAPRQTAIRPRHVAAPAHPDPAAIQQLADRIAVAARPLIVTASAGTTAVAVEMLAELAEQWAIPVVSHNPRVLCLPSSHPMHFGFEPAPLIHEADLLLVIEADVPFIPSNDQPSPSCWVAHIGEDPAFVRYPMRSFATDLAIASNAAPALAALNAALRPRLSVVAERIAVRRRALARQADLRRAQIDERGHADAAQISPARLSRAISHSVGGDAVIFNEYPLILDQCPREKPGTYFGLSPAGGLGWGLGAALGAKLAAPDRFVVATIGDGAYLFTNPTACHWVAQAHGLPVLTVVFNNGRYGAVRRATLSMFKDGAAGIDDGRFLAELDPSPPYEALISAQGGHGERVEQADQLAPALARARDAVVNGGRQALVNVICPY